MVGARDRRLHPFRAAVLEAPDAVREPGAQAPERLARYLRSAGDAGGARRERARARARRSRPGLIRTEAEFLPEGVAPPARRTRLVDRLLSRRGAILLFRNTVVSTGVFLLG